MHPTAILHESQQLYSVSDRLDSLAEQRPSVSEALITISGSVDNGDVVAAKIKRIKSHVPTMLLSAYGPLPHSKLKAMDTCLPKFQPPEILLSTLQNLLDGQSKPFFHRWLDHWKVRNEAVTQ
jgi:hypothetical protein